MALRRLGSLLDFTEHAEWILRCENVKLRDATGLPLSPSLLNIYMAPRLSWSGYSASKLFRMWKLHSYCSLIW